MKIEDLISKFSKELVKENERYEQSENLLRLKETAKLYSGEDQVVSFKEIAEKVKENVNPIKIMTGWNDLDKIIRGFRPQQLVVVSAPTKSGKTTWLMELSSKVKEYDPTWLCFEESAEELVEKYMERGIEIPHGFAPVVTLGNSVEWIESKIIESIAKYNSRVFFIDHLGFIVPTHTSNYPLMVEATMRALKGLAKKWGIVIFLIAHITKNEISNQPDLNDIRGSSSIAQEADTVIMLWRESKRENGKVITTNNVNISVQANRRHGSTGNVEMVYDGKHFYEKAWSENAKADSEFNQIKY